VRCDTECMPPWPDGLRLPSRPLQLLSTVSVRAFVRVFEMERANTEIMLAHPLSEVGHLPRLHRIVDRPRFMVTGRREAVRRTLLKRHPDWRVGFDDPEPGTLWVEWDR